MSSEPEEAYVWVWLPGAEDPVVAGVLEPAGPIFNFTYARSYLDREEAFPLYLPELPLERGPIPPRAGEIAGCISDAGPDAWGQRVILNHRVGRDAVDTADLGTLTYLLASGSDRIGALDFQQSPSEYVPRTKERRNSPSSPSWRRPRRRSSGASRSQRPWTRRSCTAAPSGALVPKALLEGRKPQADREVHARPPTDTRSSRESSSRWSWHAARGSDVAGVELTHALGRDAILVERFDRPAAGRRRPVVSALTVLELDEVGARYASYADLADLIRARFTDPIATLHKLFARITFNILVGNSDDHARNHAAFWDGAELTLTPAFDICPQSRGGGEASQAMAIGADGYRMSQVAGCIARAATYRLSENEARKIVDRQIDVIGSQWDEVCDLAEMSRVDRAGFWRRQFLNDYALQGY